MGWVVKCWHINKTNLYPRFISTPAAATPPPPPGLAHSAENNDNVDFLGFEDVLQEAENLMRNQGDNDSDSDDGDSGNEMATGSTY